MSTVLVTGATGFIGSHVVLTLLDRGYDVRGTARSPEKAEALGRTLSEYAGRPVAIELVPADLASDEGWDEAMKGVRYVQHVASPFPPAEPATADELIGPARDGALRVLRSAKAAGVERVVMTSSAAAISSGWGDDAPAMFDETHWSRLEGGEPVSFYEASKTLAEQAAWDYVADEGKGLELAVINPTAVLGPVMSADLSTSLALVEQPLKRGMPAYPKLSYGIVDVRDVALTHVEAMEKPAAAGERFIANSDERWMSELGAALKDAYPERKLPKGELPNWLVRLVARFNPVLRQTLPRLGQDRHYSNTKAETLLGMKFRSPEEAARASAESLIALGQV